MKMWDVWSAVSAVMLQLQEQVICTVLAVCWLQQLSTLWSFSYLMKYFILLWKADDQIFLGESWYASLDSRGAVCPNVHFKTNVLLRTWRCAVVTVLMFYKHKCCYLHWLHLFCSLQVKCVMIIEQVDIWTHWRCLYKASTVPLLLTLLHQNT